MDFTVTSFLTEFNALLPDLNKFIRNRLPLLHSDSKMKIAFPGKSIKAIYKRDKNLKEILSPLSFLSTKKSFQPATVIRDALYVLVLWFLIIPLNAQQQVGTMK